MRVGQEPVLPSVETQVLALAHPVPDDGLGGLAKVVPLDMEPSRV
jgi:hypothetical protein